MNDHDRFTKYVNRLTDQEALILHRIVCRRAASIYAPMYAARQQANYEQAMANRLAVQSA